MNSRILLLLPVLFIFLNNGSFLPAQSFSRSDLILPQLLGASSTSIPSTVTKDRTHVRSAIYTLQGQQLQTLVNDTLYPCLYDLEWVGKEPGGTVNSGIVIYRFQTLASGNGGQSHFKKLVIAP